MKQPKKIDWLNHFLEFIVVIIGILIAFQLNTCAVEKKQSKLIESHFTNILEETEFNRRNITSSISATNRLIGQIDSISTLIKEGQNLQQINGLAFQILSINITYFKTNAYSSLIETGDIRFINDFNTKNDIIQLYEYYNWAKGVEEVSLDSYSKYYYPYVLENLDLLEGKPQQLEVYSNKEFLNIVSSYRYMMASNLTRQEETLTQIEKFLENYNSKY